jgi:hypothetical protein
MVEAENKDVPTREIILKELNTAHQELKHKAIHGRTRSPENDRIKVQWFKTWIYCLNSMATVLKEKDLDELTENLEDVKRVLSSTPEVKLMSSGHQKSMRKLLTNFQYR